jgi:phage gp36-like protein
MATLVSYALTNLADVKESLGLPGSDHTKDNLIIRKVNAATDMIESFCGRRFLSTTYNNIEYDANNALQLILNQRPITDFASLDIRDTSFDINDWETVNPQLYFVDAAAAVIDLNFRAIGRWNRYRVTYTAGYDTVPNDLAEACASIAAYLTINARGEIGVIEKQEGQRRARYNDGIKGLKDLFSQLGVDQTIAQYANEPILADK